MTTLSTIASVCVSTNDEINVELNDCDVSASPIDARPLRLALAVFE